MVTDKPTKPNSTKKEFLIFISIPLGIILLVSLIMFVPSLFAKPSYDFIYSYCPEYSCSNDFTVLKDGTIRETTSGKTTYEYTGLEIYYFDTQNNSSKKIDLEDAKSYQLNSSTVSPDGYSLSSSQNSGGGFMFWGYSNNNNWYLKNGLKKKQIDLAGNNYYSSNIELIGWIE